MYPSMSMAEMRVYENQYARGELAWRREERARKRSAAMAATMHEEMYVRAIEEGARFPFDLHLNGDGTMTLLQGDKRYRVSVEETA